MTVFQAYPWELEAQGRGDILDAVSANHRAQSHTVTHYRKFRDVSQPMACVWIEGGNCSTQRNPTKHGENMQSLHTHRMEVEIRSCEANP